VPAPPRGGPHDEQRQAHAIQRQRRTRATAAQDEQLLAQQGVLGQQRRPAPRQVGPGPAHQRQRQRPRPAACAQRMT
jgi:hypothetical protein